MGGACYYLEAVYRGSVGARPVIEAVNGHHNGLVAYDEIQRTARRCRSAQKGPAGTAERRLPSKIQSSCKRQTPLQKRLPFLQTADAFRSAHC